MVQYFDQTIKTGPEFVDLPGSKLRKELKLSYKLGEFQYLNGLKIRLKSIKSYSWFYKTCLKNAPKMLD